MSDTILYNNYQWIGHVNMWIRYSYYIYGKQFAEIKAMKLIYRQEWY